MFSSWDVVRPRTWHSLASLEQSMMDLDHMADHFHRHAHHHHHHGHHHHDENDDFFADLPVRRQARDQPAPQQEQPANDSTHAKHAFSTYSFSNSTVLDDKGQRVTSTRRRYEDSSGRLKAVHEREIGDKKLRSVWNRSAKDGEENHEKTLIGGGEIDEFEAAWKQTAFGVAQEKHEDVKLVSDKEQPPALE